MLTGSINREPHRNVVIGCCAQAPTPVLEVPFHQPWVLEIDGKDLKKKKKKQPRDNTKEVVRFHYDSVGGPSLCLCMQFGSSQDDHKNRNNSRRCTTSLDSLSNS